MKKRIKTSSCKAKGRTLQRFVVNSILTVKRLAFKEGDVESRPTSSFGVDIMMSPLAKELLPVSLECKNTRLFPSLNALRQSQANKYDNTIAAVVWKPPGKGFEESIIYFNFNEFISKISIAYHKEDQ